MNTVTTLDSGLRIVTEEMPFMDSAALGLWIGVGGRHEPRRLNGISHFLEHLLFKGTLRRSARQISEEIESVGGSLNGFTGEEYTCYTAKVPHRHLRRAAEVLSDMYLNPAMKAEDIAREKTVIREEINLYRDTPQHHVIDLFNAVTWDDHPLGRPLVGTAETVAAFTRDELRRYHRRNYAAPATVLSAAGRVLHGEVVRLAGDLMPAPGKWCAARVEEAFDLQRRPALLLHRKKTEQTHLCVGVRGYHRTHPFRYALQLLSIALGENMSSRLFQQIREKHGLAYAIHSSVTRYRDTGAFSVYAGVENAKTGKALALIMRELAKARRDGLAPRELERAREYWIGQLRMEMEKTSHQMLQIGEHLLCTGRVLTRDEIIANILRVEVEDVRRVAAELFTDRKLNCAVIGPLPERDEELRDILHF